MYTVPQNVPLNEEASVLAIETALNSMFTAAQTAGERFVDVASGALSRAVSGKDRATKGAARCCRVMRRVMVAGDAELSSSRGSSSTTVLIRYALPRYAGSKHLGA